MTTNRPEDGRKRARHLLVLAHGSGRGGAEYCLETALKCLDHTTWKVTVLFPSEGPMSESARQMGCRVRIVPVSWWMCEELSLFYFRNLIMSLVRVISLARWIRKNQVDVVYTNTAVVFEGAIAAWLARVPHVWHVHEVLKGKHLWFFLLPVPVITRLIGKLSARVIFESNAALEVCRGHIPDGKMLTVYNSLRSSEPVTEKEMAAARERFGLSRDRCVVAWAGNFSLRKNPLMLIRAVHRMQKSAAADFLFVGRGPIEDEMHNTVKQLGLENRCRIIPFQDNIWPLLHVADILVLTSHEESFGLVLIEAGACGRPVVATRTQGPAEIVVDGETGFLIEPGDEVQLAAKLDQLVEDRLLREEMGRAGAIRVNELFSASRNTAKIQAVFEEVLSA